MKIIRHWLEQLPLLRLLCQPSLFRRLLLWQAASVLVLYSLVTLGQLWRSQAPQGGTLARELSMIAGAGARFASLDTRPERAQAVARQLQEIVATQGITVKAHEFAIQIWDRDGTLLARDALTDTLPLTRPGSAPVETRTQLGHWYWLGAWSPDRKIWAVVGLSQAFYERNNAELAHVFLLALLVLHAMLLCGLWLATRMGLKPLASLSERIRQRTADDPTSLARLRDDPLELAPIIAALDAQAAQVARLRSTERRFFADAAHELRTPLAVISAQVHVLAQERDPARLAQLQAALQRGVQRSAQVLTKVLTLARLDALERVPRKLAVDIPELLQARIAEYAPLAIAKALDLGLKPSPACRIEADEDLLISALDNLIANAIHYVPSGGTVSLGCRQFETSMEIFVEDDGHGIAPDERERIFNRFERGRSAAHTSGSGLGLAIARDIARLHGGDLLLTCPATGGCCFVMRLPR